MEEKLKFTTLFALIILILTACIPIVSTAEIPTISEKYLEVSGQGDLALIIGITQTLSPAD